MTISFRLSPPALQTEGEAIQDPIAVAELLRFAKKKRVRGTGLRAGATVHPERVDRRPVPRSARILS